MLELRERCHKLEGELRCLRMILVGPKPVVHVHPVVMGLAEDCGVDVMEDGVDVVNNNIDSVASQMGSVDDEHELGEDLQCVVSSDGESGEQEVVVSAVESLLKRPKRRTKSEIEKEKNKVIEERLMSNNVLTLG